MKGLRVSQNTVTIENRTEYMRLVLRTVGESMSLLPLEYENTVVKLIMVAFDTGYEIALNGKAEVEI